MWDLLLKPDSPDKDPALVEDWLSNHEISVQNMYRAAAYNLDNNPRVAYLDLRRLQTSGVDVSPLLDKGIDTFKSVQIVLDLWRRMLRNRSATLSHANLILRLTSSWKLKSTALRVLKQMKAHGIEADHETHALVISTIGRERLGNHEEALEYFQGLIDKGFEPDVQVYTSMITACKTGDSVDTAKNVLQMYIEDENAYKVIKPFNAIIGLTAKNGQIDFAIRMLRNLHSFNVNPSAASFFIVISIIQQEYPDEEILREAEQLFYLMVREEIPPMPDTCRAAIDIGERIDSPLLVQSAQDLLEMTQNLQDHYNNFSKDDSYGYDY